MGAYVSLLEYNDIEGMILMSELSRRRIRSVNKLIRVGRIECVLVLRVDEEKGYIDLSKRRVSPEDIAAIEEKYNKSKTVHSILRHVCETTQAMDLEDLYKKVGWPLYRKFGHAYDAFRVSIKEPEKIWPNTEEIPEEVMAQLKVVIAHRMTQQPIKVRAELEVTCFHYEGIDAIKAALRSAEACSKEGLQVKVHLLAPPQYVVETTTTDKDAGIAILETAINKIKESLENMDGKVTVKDPPKSVSQADDVKFDTMMQKLTLENEEKDGDDDDDEDDE